MNKIIALDPGNMLSGIIILQDGKITHAENANNVDLWSLIQEHKGSTSIVVIEDIKPYSLKVSQQVIDTCKFIGVMQYRLKMARIRSQTVSRSEVKEWIFTKYGYVAIPRIEKKILYAHDRSIKNGKRGLMNKDGTMRKPSHNWVDDRIVIACMKLQWDIDTPKPGKMNRLGITKHSWQALAVASWYLFNQKTAV